ncbi:MAG: cob(I)yrinic acid a,c-diamide adenosyltransferase [Candidatus Hodarchaeales archaeon]|jgi:cob(I)alamin adenosyltransferase
MSKERKKSSELGLIHVITGDGKGKTTSALGLALRAAGHSYNTLIIQFMKKGWDYGELKILDTIPQITIIQYGTPEFVDRAALKKIDLDEARAALARARKAILEERWDILILDEINVAIDFNLISETDILDLIKQKPSNLELVLTGRNASNNIIDRADYHTEIHERKHPYQKNILARKGVEY